MRARGGIDLGGTKIQAVVVDGRNQVRGEARRPTPQKGGPPDVAAAIADALREAAAAAGTSCEQLVGVGVGSPGEVRRARRGSSSRRATSRGGTTPIRSGPVLAKELGTPVRLGNDVDVAVAGEFRLGAGKPYSTPCSACGGAPASAAGSSSTIASGTGAARPARSATWWSRSAGAAARAAAAAAWRPTPARAAMEARARKLVGEGRKTRLFEIMEERGRDRLTSGVWERALRKGDKLTSELIDEAVDALGAGVASACNLLDVEAVIVGGGLGTRFGSEYAERIREAMLPHLFVDDDPPDVHVAALGDLGGAIGAALLVSGGAQRSRR